MAPKLNSLRLLSQRKIPHTVYEFPADIHDAEAVAQYLQQPADQVYKTLVVLSERPRAKPMLIMLAANQQLDLKQAARGLGEKKVRLAGHTQAEQLTGLQVGGISALALLNQGFSVYLDETARHLDRIVISAGQRGVNVAVPVAALVKVTGARWIAATSDGEGT